MRIISHRTELARWIKSSKFSSLHFPSNWKNFIQLIIAFKVYILQSTSHTNPSPLFGHSRFLPTSRTCVPHCSCYRDVLLITIASVTVIFKTHWMFVLRQFGFVIVSPKLVVWRSEDDSSCDLQLEVMLLHSIANISTSWLGEIISHNNNLPLNLYRVVSWNIQSMEETEISMEDGDFGVFPRPLIILGCCSVRLSMRNARIWGPKIAAKTWTKSWPKSSWTLSTAVGPLSVTSIHNITPSFEILLPFRDQVLV